MNKLLNLGSLNIDHTYAVQTAAEPGETVKAQGYARNIGGKGLNQSVAFARAGGTVCHGGKIGPEGLFLKEFLTAEGVDASRVLESTEPTGHAVIQVESTGQNCIVVYGGANRTLTEAEIDAMLEGFGEGDFLLLQNEVNRIGYAAQQAKKRGMQVVLNPSPAEDLDIPLDLVDWFVLNEHEAGALFGPAWEAATGNRASASPKMAAICMIPLMKQTCPGAKFVLTLGENGAMYFDETESVHQEAFRVDAVDTTGAGDTFTGYFLQAILAGKTPAEALERAAKAAALAVTRPGAAAAIPRAEELK